MNLKSLLIGSAAALSSVTVANAADAIVAAEPEALEYVRVCDAFGTGFFYIPGTETCLKIGGYARFQVDFGSDARGLSDWNASSRGEVTFDARSETEIGTLQGFIDLRFNADSAAAPAGGVLQQGFIEVAGFRAGKFNHWWDDGLSGETDSLGDNTNFNSIRYVVDAGGVIFGVSVDELESHAGDATDGSPRLARARVTDLGGGQWDTTPLTQRANNVGISANVAATMGGVNVALLGSYDVDFEEGSIRGLLTADVGTGTFGLGAMWSSGANSYNRTSEWAVAAEYALKATDRLTITPGVQWNANRAIVFRNGTFDEAAGDYVAFNGNPADEGFYLATDRWSNVDSWQAGLTVDYAITSGLNSKVSMQWEDVDGEKGEFSGFVRLDRTF